MKWSNAILVIVLVTLILVSCNKSSQVDSDNNKPPSNQDNTTDMDNLGSDSQGIFKTDGSSDPPGEPEVITKIPKPEYVATEALPDPIRQPSKIEEEPAPVCSPSVEICDGTDNDCDGKVDEGNVCAECINGETKKCGSTDIGACAFGIQTCTSKVWGNCMGKIEPAIEICNIKDDDCDSSIDEENICGECVDGQIRECGSTDVGACTFGSQLCSAGAWEDCIGDIAPVAEICNNKDDDCDGEVDEGCPVCGNDVAETAEVCDGMDLNGQSCTSQGFDSGSLLCKTDCSGYDTSNCQNNEAHDITITNSYTPKTLTISIGDTVIWYNDDSSDRWPATDQHPSHTEYPGSDINKCDTPDQSTIFDACGQLTPGNTYSFTFTVAGSWDYHDHLKPGMTGTIIVQ